MVRAVLFDFNGVIVDDEHLHFELFRQVLGEEGVALSEHDYHERFLGFDDRGCFSAALLQAGQSADTERIDGLIRRKAFKYEQAATHGLRYFPGALERIVEFSQLWPIAVCSGALRSEIEFALVNLGVREKVRAIVSAEDTTECKPDPEGYLLAMRALCNLACPELASLSPLDCVAIEDSVAGISAARAAGMIAVGVAHTYTTNELEAAGAHFVSKDLLELTSDALIRIAKEFEKSEAQCVASDVGLLVSRDLIFTTKIEGTALALGRRMLVTGSRSDALEWILENRPKLVVVDLNAGDAANPSALASYREASSNATSLIAFGSHVDIESLRIAREAGFDAMPRSRFSAELAKILGSLLSGPTS